MLYMRSPRCVGSIISSRILGKCSISSVHSSKPKVLLLDPIKLAHDQLVQLEQVSTIVNFSSPDRSSFISDLSGLYSDVTAIYRHFKGTGSITVTGRFDHELISALPSSLRFIASNGAGYDQISVPQCTARKIQVSNVPSVVDNPTADTALFLILGVLRQFRTAMNAAQVGSFNNGLPLSSDPYGKTLGIIGMGGIGRALAKRAAAIGMLIQYHNRSQLPTQLEHGAKYVSREELLSTSDVISLNLPLNTETRHTISYDEFQLMRPTAVLINTARGAIVNEIALINALNAGAIVGVGLDVYENEPHIPKDLLQHPRALCLPHVGTLSFETQREMEAFCLRNIMAGLKSGKMTTVVSEQSALLLK